MSEQPSAYAEVIADLKRRRDSIDSLIAELMALSGEGPSQGVGVSSALSSGGHEESTTPSGNNPYLGMSIPEATVAVLKAKRCMLRSAEIVKALEEGGLILGGHNNSNTVNSVLHRRQKQVGDVVSPKRGHWGLKEWYPGRVFVKLGDSSRGGAKKGDAEKHATAPIELTEPQQSSEPIQAAPDPSDKLL